MPTAVPTIRPRREDEWFGGVLVVGSMPVGKAGTIVSVPGTEVVTIKVVKCPLIELVLLKTLIEVIVTVDGSAESCKVGLSVSSELIIVAIVHYCSRKSDVRQQEEVLLTGEKGRHVCGANLPSLTARRTVAFGRCFARPRRAACRATICRFLVQPPTLSSMTTCKRVLPWEEKCGHGAHIDYLNLLLEGTSFIAINKNKLCLTLKGSAYPK